MRTANTYRKTSLALASALALATSLFVAPAQAEIYKIKNPDGTVTFTDKPPVQGKGLKNAEVVGSTGRANVPSNFPATLRKAAGDFPVTLFATKDCTACDSVRDLLQTRGIPFSEKSVLTQKDAAELKKIAGTASTPVIRIGSKVLPAPSGDTVHKYLSAAGYPKDSELPQSYRPLPAEPLTTANTAPEAPKGEPEPAENKLPEAPGGFRF
ncbi:glutaredoxin family protein [Hydrogenophaga sp. 5NK40-0174]|uniref:glutaredoxin family protein n=1 Tax=Hydrogenophaga sp. 5NK40-0174 TaxID=3127649 RepID=UPI003107E5E6